MKNLFKSFNINQLGFILALIALASACTSVNFRNPVPQGGSALRSFPADWTGVYVEEPEPGTPESFYRHCIRLERAGDDRLFVSEETRIQEKDMPKLRQDLEQQQKDGKLKSYLLTERFVFTTVNVEDKDRPNVKEEQQFTRLFKEGGWYILGHSAEPILMFDLKSARMTGYDVSTGNHALYPVLGPDSLAAEDKALVARQKDQGFYFNMPASPDSLWQLYYVARSGKGGLLLKSSNLKNKNEFESRLDHYNAITPFVKMEQSDNYVIDPDDRALEQLLTDDKLFEVTRLRKIGGE